MRTFFSLCFYTLAVAATPADPQLSAEEALALRRIADFWEEGEYHIAKNEMEDFLAEFSENLYSDTLRMTLGDLFLREKSYQLALNYYAQIKDASLADKALSNRMQCLYHLQWHATLADVCEEHLQTGLGEKELLEATYFLAIALYQQCLSPGKDEAAIQSLAERAKPYFERLSNSELSDEVAGAFAHLQCILKDFQSASDIYLRLSKKHDHSEEFLFQAALIQSKYDKSVALQTFDTIAKKDGLFSKEAAYNQLILSFDLGKHQEITETKEALLESIPQERKTLAHLFIGQSFLTLEQYREAAAEFNAFLDGNIDSDSTRPALTHLLEASYKANDLELLDKAIDRLKQFDPIDEGLPKALFSRVQLLKKRERFEDAKVELRSLLAQFPQFPDRPFVSFEIAYLESIENHWMACRESAQSFLQEYPSHELRPFAHRTLIRASMELANQAEEFKQQVITDIEELLTTENFLSSSEKLDFQFHLAKAHFEVGSFGTCSKILETLLTESTLFDQRANAELLFALSVCENRELFCTWGEAALSHNANLISVADQHVALFNAYIDSSKEKAADHLYAAFQSKANIQLPNLLWLANDLYTRSLNEKAFEVISVLLAKELPMKDKEPLILKAAKLHAYFGRTAESIALLEELNAEYSQSPEMSWSCKKETKFTLAKSLLDNGQQAPAELLFDEISSSTVLRDRFAAEAALESTRLKRLSPNPDFAAVLSKLKDLVLQKNIENEPVHLEAAIDYIDLQTELEAPEKRASKRLNLLVKTKNDFQQKEDLLSKDYHAARNQLHRQNQIYLAYMNYLDAQIFLAKSDLDVDSEQQKELQAKAKDILLQIAGDAPDLLRARLNSNEKR